MELYRIVENTLVPHTAFMEASARLKQCFDYADGISEPMNLLIDGESRAGKTRVLEEFCAKHPERRDGPGLEIPIIRIRTPAKPTVKGLVNVLLRGTKDPRFFKGSLEEKTDRLVTLMKQLKTRAIMIDEFQHFYDRDSHRLVNEVSDWLKVFLDEQKIAIVVAGLPSCRAVMHQREQLAGRFMAPIRMPRFDWTIAAHREELCAILQAFHVSLAGHFELPVLDSPEMAFRCYCASGGLMGYMTRFLRQAVRNALDANTRKITLEDLDRAQRESVWENVGPAGLAAPFGRSFVPLPTADLLQKISMLGAAASPTEPTRRTRGPKARKPPIAGILAAHSTSDV